MNDKAFKSPLCKEGKHRECESSAFLGICGCECHDYLDEPEERVHYGDDQRNQGGRTVGSSRYLV
jgi:hypothetical protein